MTDQIVGSLSETVDREPYGHYDQATARCPVSWDEELQAWVIYDHESIKAVLRTDIDVIRQPELDDLELSSAIDGSHQALKYLSGEKQRRVHRWYLQTLSPEFIGRQRETAIQPIVEGALRGIVRDGRADLAEDFAERIPIRVAAAVLGLPWRDDEWIARVRESLDTIGHFYASRLTVTDEDKKRAVAASANLNEMFRPFVDEGRSGDGDHMISRLWRDGPGLSPDWWRSTCWADTDDYAGRDRYHHAHHVQHAPLPDDPPAEPGRLCAPVTTGFAPTSSRRVSA